MCKVAIQPLNVEQSNTKVKRSKQIMQSSHFSNGCISSLPVGPHIIIIYLTINVKKQRYKNGYRRLSCTSKTAKIHRFVRSVMYCLITIMPVAFYWARSDDTVPVHYKSDETVPNFCGFRCATKSPITVFINIFFTFIFAVFYFPVCLN